MKSYKNISIDSNEQNLMEWIHTQSPIVVCIEAGQNVSVLLFKTFAELTIFFCEFTGLL